MDNNISDLERYRQYLQDEPEPVINPMGLIDDRAKLLAEELPEIEQVCGPLHSASITMIAGAAGVGKSLFALHMANAIANGQDLESWKTPERRFTLYVDGEMAPQYLQGRLKSMRPPGPSQEDWLGLLHLGQMAKTGQYVDLAKSYWRDYFLSPYVLGIYDVIIFDTVSSLVLPTEQIGVYSPEFWLQLEPFHQQLRAAGKTVVWIDNLNKQGQVFGTNVKHHKVDALWQFEPWKDKPPAAKAGFRMEGIKNRGGWDEPEGHWYLGSDGMWTHAI